MSTDREPTPVLKDNRIYCTFDEFVCNSVGCAGMSALYTGITIGGCKVVPLRAADVAAWDTYDLGPLHCSCGRLTARLDSAFALKIEATPTNEGAAK